MSPPLPPLGRSVGGASLHGLPVSCRVRAELEDAKQKVKNENEDDVSPDPTPCCQRRAHFAPLWVEAHIPASPVCFGRRATSRRRRGSASPGWRWPES